MSIGLPCMHFSSLDRAHVYNSASSLIGWPVDSECRLIKKNLSSSELERVMGNSIPTTTQINRQWEHTHSSLCSENVYRLFYVGQRCNGRGTALLHTESLASAQKLHNALSRLLGRLAYQLEAAFDAKRGRGGGWSHFTILQFKSKSQGLIWSVLRCGPTAYFDWN